MRAAVIVLGDLGRSPRMQHHALALAAGADVDLIGLAGAPLHAAVAAEPRIHPHRLSDRAFRSRETGGTRRFVLVSAFRALSQGVRLFWRLLRIPRPDVILVQTPPATPSLAVCWSVARLRGARLVVDWHNLAHTVLAVRLGDRARAVGAVRRAERRWGRRADGHLAVSRSLAEWLAREFGIHATVVHDRPIRSFVRPEPDVAARCREKVAAAVGLAGFRGPMVLAPTSWTPDEDFDLLIEALERTERSLSANRDATAGPCLALVLTGRGPGRAAFERRIARRPFAAIAVRTAWLEPDDYPVAIGAADLGLCLHQSTSGLDLPLKIADFRGAGVPVCAFDYAPVIAERLTDGEEGVLIRDAGSLADVLSALTRPDAPAATNIDRCRAWLAAHPAERWEEHWERTARPVIRGM